MCFIPNFVEKIVGKLAIIVFYNFSEYGKNYPDRLVGGFDELGDSICPRVRFLDEDHACAFADDQKMYNSKGRLTYLDYV